MVQLKLLLFSKRHRFVLDPLLLILALVQKYYKTPPSPEKKGLYVNFNKKKHKGNKMKNYTVFNFPGKKLLSTCSKFQLQNSHVLLKLNKFQDHWRMKIKNFNRKINKYIFPNSVGALQKVEGYLAEKYYKKIIPISFIFMVKSPPRSKILESKYLFIIDPPKKQKKNELNAFDTLKTPERCQLVSLRCLYRTLW